jgi:nucleoid-associated protein YgaU
MRGDAWRVGFICLVVAALVTGSLTGDAAVEPITVRLPVVIHTDDPGFTTVVVGRGDHLWKISRRRLDAVLGREPENAEVGPYWREVIEVNRHGLRSGDPDLIYPGEMVTLPLAR